MRKKPISIWLEPRHREIIARMLDDKIRGFRAENMGQAIRASLEYVDREFGEA